MKTFYFSKVRFLMETFSLLYLSSNFGPNHRSYIFGRIIKQPYLYSTIETFTTRTHVNRAPLMLVFLASGWIKPIMWVILRLIGPFHPTRGDAGTSKALHIPVSARTVYVVSKIL